MKYIVLTYNYLTLVRALKYINDVWGRENSVILYMNLVSKFPERIMLDYTAKEIKCKSLNAGKHGFSLLRLNIVNTRRTWKCVNQLLDSFDTEFVICLFKDNELLEATVIENAMSKFGYRCHIWLIEEGTGLYASTMIKPRFPFVKRFINHHFGLSNYGLKAIPQGMHPFLEKIICTKPELFKRKVNRENLEIEKMQEVFTDDLNDYFVRLILQNKEKKNYDYVFLTQPFRDLKLDYDYLLNKHKKYLPLIFEILSNYGRVLIKLHPREHFDYKQYTNEKIDIVEGVENNIPFECLMSYYGNPQMISMYSSTSINIKSSKRSIFLGKLFDFPDMETLFPNEFYEENNIISCGNMVEFKNAVKNSRR